MAIASHPDRPDQRRPSIWASWAVIISCLLLFGSALSSVAVGARQAGPRPPQQPAHGPGGADYAFASVRVRRVGEPPVGSWLFSPAAPLAPTGEDDGPPGGAADSLPVVIFLHGLGALDPIVYRGWIDHLVRRGAFVVYPDYQPTNPLAAPWSTFLPNLQQAVAAAREELTGGNGARPDWSRVAVVGHSLGGVMALAYAAAAPTTEGRVPVPAVVMAVQPGGCRGCGGLTDEGGVPLPDLRQIEPATRVLVVVAEEDEVVGDQAARRIWRALAAVPLANRDYVVLRSDRRGAPPLVADHLLAQTAGPNSATDALDWFGTWKLLDGLTDCAFADRGCEAALGGRPEQRFMGEWSDGALVVEALVGDAPDAVTRTPSITPALTPTSPAVADG